MAEPLSVRGANVKIRNPLGVFALSLVTLGIYSIFWYYFIHRELRDYGRGSAQQSEGVRRLREISPGTSVLAITLGGFLIVPPFVSAWRSFGRIETAQRVSGIPELDRVGVGLGFALYFIELVAPLFFSAAYAQSHLNRVWRAEQAAAERRLAANPPAFTG
ncbi:MAG: DUF4234 domain-containing protein [Actinomycetota bacterium]|nr:DUF4234 domain-containing protein [Actinomycetota bacterium]